jgi:hypothetical protein
MLHVKSLFHVGDQALGKAWRRRRDIYAHLKDDFDRASAITP